VMTTLVAVLDLAKRYKLIRENPAREAERPKLATADEDSFRVTASQVYSKTEIRRLIAATEPGSRDKVFIMLLSFLGLRIGEALALTWPAVDLKTESPKLEVRLNLGDAGKGEEPLFQTPKTKSSRRVLPLSAELTRELRVWKLKCPPSERDLVFATEEGKPFHRKSASKMLYRAIERAGLKKRLTPHGLRHTFASLLLADGKPAPARTAVRRINVPTQAASAGNRGGRLHAGHQLHRFGTQDAHTVKFAEVEEHPGVAGEIGGGSEEASVAGHATHVVGRGVMDFPPQQFSGGPLLKLCRSDTRAKRRRWFEHCTFHP